MGGEQRRLSRAQEVDAELEALYAQVPAIGCKGLCTDACGPIDGGPRELVRMARAGVKLPPRGEAVRQMYARGHYTCPALVDGRCSTYEARPFICRAWGASEDLPCPYGCAPEDGRLLTSAQALHLLDASEKAGSGQDARPVEEYEELLNRPGVRERLKAHIPTPVATQPISPKENR